MARLTGLLGLFLLACTHSGQAQEDATAPASCASEMIGTFTAGAALDGRTFRLQDGREVLLAGIEGAPIPDPQGSGAGAAAKATLEKLIAGSMVTLKKAAANDRYGRLIAQVFVPQEGAERWIQQEMLALGQAQVGTRPGNAACAQALLSAEAPARQGKLGLWADSHYSTKASDDAAGLLAGRGRFTIAEGKVLSVRESGGTLYMNFGRVWSRNLTVTVLRRNRRAFAAAGLDPKKLEGMRVRVRGWVEERGGPRIEAVRPEQIEIAAQE